MKKQHVRTCKKYSMRVMQVKTSKEICRGPIRYQHFIDRLLFSKIHKIKYLVLMYLLIF